MLTLLVVAHLLLQVQGVCGNDGQRDNIYHTRNVAWEEGMVVYPVQTEYGGKLVVGSQGGDWAVGGDGGENAALVKAEFTLHSEGIGTESSQYVPAGIHSLVAEFGVVGLEVGYTRGNRGFDMVDNGLQLPSWYVDAAPGLNVKVEIDNSNYNRSIVEKSDGLGEGEGAAKDDDVLDGVLRVLTKLVGSSAPTIRSRGSYVLTDGDGRLRLEGFSTQDFPCLESIFAWIKLLPCGGQRGLSRVLKGMSLVETPYHSMHMGLKVGESREIVLDISVTTLLNNHAYARDVWHRRVQSFTIDEILSGLYSNGRGGVLQGQSLDNSGVIENCPVSGSKDPDGAMVLLLQRAFPRTIHGCSTTKVKDDDSNPPEYKRCFLSSRQGEPKWEASRESGNEKTRQQCMEKVDVGKVDVSNNVIMRTPLVATLNSHVTIKSLKDGDDGTIVKYFQMVPWEIPMRLESLKVMLFRGAQTQINVCLDNDKARWKKQGCTVVEGMSVLSVHTKAAIPRALAGWFEIQILVTSYISNDKELEFNVLVDIEKRVLSVFDYPPDMSRGIDIPAPVVEVSGRQATDARHISIDKSIDSVTAYGQNVLIQLPIPDASMPFNVACFTATLVSLIFGSVMNMSIWSRKELDEIRLKSKTAKKKLVRFVVVLVVGGSMLLYYDPSAQATVMGYVLNLKQTLGI